MYWANFRTGLKFFVRHGKRCSVFAVPDGGMTGLVRGFAQCIFFLFGLF
jgi:hypothetical protein